MKLLLTNDDGIDAPGLAALAEVAKAWGEVTVVAPKECWSGCGHRICTDRDIEVVERQPGWWSVDAYPADCVRLALSCLLEDVDWVLAGINDGGNLGSDVFVSGTVAAAREAVLFQKPAMALSQYRARGERLGWEESARMASGVLEQLLSRPPEPGALWNVNLPDRSTSDPNANREPVHCEVDAHPLPAHYERQGNQFRYAGSYQSRDRAPNSDVEQCFNGSISISHLWVHPQHGPR